MHQQNTGSCALVFSYCFGSAESTTCWLLPDLADDLLLFLMVLISCIPQKGLISCISHRSSWPLEIQKPSVLFTGKAWPTQPHPAGWCRLLVGGGGGRVGEQVVEAPRRAGCSPCSPNHTPLSNNTNSVSLSLRQDPLSIKYWIKTIRTMTASVFMRCVLHISLNNYYD